MYLFFVQFLFPPLDLKQFIEPVEPNEKFVHATFSCIKNKQKNKKTETYNAP